MTDYSFEGFFQELERVRLDFSSLLRELSDIPFASTVADGAGWSEPLSAWWARERDAADPEVAALFEKLVDHGRVLFLLAEQLGAPRRGGTSGDEADLMVLLETFQRSMAECLKAVTMPGGGMFSPMSHLVDSWQQHAAHAFGLPRNLAETFPDMLKARDAASFREAMNVFVDPAASAASQLHGKPLQELAEALVGYQDSFNRFSRMAVGATGDAIARMQTALASIDADETRGVREFYDLWLECCEQTYDELARNPDFAGLMGELVDNAVRVYAARQRLADSAAESLGLPTRRHVRELSASLHETRRRLARLERGAEPAGGNSLARRTRPSEPLHRAARQDPWSGVENDSTPRDRAMPASEPRDRTQAASDGMKAGKKPAKRKITGKKHSGANTGAKSRTAKKAAVKKVAKKKASKKKAAKKTAGAKKRSSTRRRPGGNNPPNSAED